ncbi:MAG: ATP-binding cassette domain-containing protein [Prevotella sp.]|jgi:ABC-type transport system involved in cytochrome bd biosynthesis fused ATPase/permease subunit|nr:ATP-binding cassette domain-containing protein [Prevotella sp.]
MLEVKDATIVIGEKTLAQGLSFTARDGQLTCITGSEGAGKTTLIRTLMGFLPVKEGFVSVDGELLTIRSAPAFRTMMVYLPQQMQMLRHQLMPPEAPACESDEQTVWAPVLPLLQEGLGEVTSGLGVVPPLSAEEIFSLASETLQQATDKPIVIADEPAAHLTFELTQRMLELLREQAAAGKTVLIASRKAEIIANADQIIDLDRL